MFKPRKKISKKELKHDKLVTWYFEVNDYVTKNQKTILTIGISLLVLVLLVFFLYIKPHQENEELASTALGNITGFYDYRQYQMAMEGIPERNVIGLKKIVEDYGSTEAGEMAKIYLGNCYLILKDYDNAFKCFDEFNGSGKLYKVSAISGKGTALEAKKQYAEAAAQFEKAADKASDDLQSPENLMNASRNYFLGGNKAKAIELIEKIKSDYPRSAYARDYDRYLAEYQD
jgi:tetratricopeptide (TPR) repeat protein